MVVLMTQTLSSNGMRRPFSNCNHRPGISDKGNSALYHSATREHPRGRIRNRTSRSTGELALVFTTGRTQPTSLLKTRRGTSEKGIDSQPVSAAILFLGTTPPDPGRGRAKLPAFPQISAVGRARKPQASTILVRSNSSLSPPAKLQPCSADKTPHRTPGTVRAARRSGNDAHG
jgi:hypothetical protein